MQLSIHSTELRACPELVEWTGFLLINDFFLLFDGANRYPTYLDIFILYTIRSTQYEKSHGDFLKISLISGSKFSIIRNKLNIEYRTHRTGDRMEKAGTGKSGYQGVAIRISGNQEST